MDARIFSAQSFVFAELNEDAVSTLLNRTLANGGGNTFYNLAPEGGPETRGWLQAIGTFINGDSSAGAAGLSATTGGVEGGADVILPSEIRLGAAVGYQETHLSDDAGSTANEDLVRVSLYGSKTAGLLGFSAAVSYAHGFDRIDRFTGIYGASASRGSDEVTGAFQVSAPFTAALVQVTPSAGVQVGHLHAGGFAEQSKLAAFAVTGAGSSSTEASPYATVGFSRPMTLASGAVITPDLTVGYRYDGLAESGRVVLTAADGTTFSGNRYDPGRSGALVGASVTAHQGDWTLAAKYRATVSGGWTDQQVQAVLRMAF